MQAAALFFSHVSALALLIWIARAEVGNFSQEDREP